MLARVFVAGSLAVALLASAQRITIAQPDEATRAEAKPGDCHYLQPGVKECYPQDGIGRFQIRTYLEASTVVRFPGPITGYLGPNETLVHTYTKKGSPYIHFTAVARRIPATATAVVRTSRHTITFDFEIVAKPEDADSQLHIVPFDERGKDAELERRVEAHRHQLETEFAQRVKRAARDRTLAGLVRHGFSRDRARATPVRHDHVILKAKERITIGTDLYVRFTVENADDSMDIGPVTVALTRGKSRKTLASRTRCQKRHLTPRRSTTCYASVGLDRAIRADERLQITVASKDGRRAATLRGIDVR